MLQGETLVKIEPVRGMLLDIEGTTSSISFVYDVMFPFVRRELQSYLAAHWDDALCLIARDKIAQEAGHASFFSWVKAKNAPAESAQPALVIAEVLRLMNADVKSTGLKQLQGLIWEQGFHSGELLAHVYDDVAPALRAWRERGLDLRIYSSGSIQAQKLFFGHTVAGNLLPLFSGHYDTTTGAKREASSYEQIASAFELPAAHIVFVSDVVPELDAARAAGMQTALVLRTGNAAVTAGHGHRGIHSFAELRL